LACARGLRLLGLHPRNVGLAFIGHLPEDRGGTGVGDRIGEPSALRYARAHVGESCILHPH
jgi:hypothetical protein